MFLAPYMKNSSTSVTALTEPQELQKLKKSKKSKKSKKLIKILPAIPGVWPAYRGVSKLADSKEEKYVVSAKYILKPATTPKPAPPMNKIKPLDLVFIDAALFQYLAKQKDMEIFAVSMQDIKNELNAISIKDIEYQLNKTAKTLTNPKTVVLKEYHKFLYIFLKETSDTLSPHSKYEYQICLLEGYRDHGNNPLRKMSELKLQFVKKFLEEHLKKSFIEASSAFCSSQIILAAKSGEGIRFCVNYRRLNELTKKDAYPILLIEEILVQLKNAKVFTKINIRQAFHKLRMTIDLEDLITFALRFGAFKWKVLLFRLTGGPASWQWSINNVLWEYLNKFCTAYLDDILIYSSNLKEHKNYVRLILAKLREFEIQVDVDKCEFHVTKTKYLRLIISTKGIKIDLAKIEAIRQ